MSSYPDNQMQSVLNHIRRYSKAEAATTTNSPAEQQLSSSYSGMPSEIERAKSPQSSFGVASAISRRQSNDIQMNDVATRRLSEAGVNRRPSAVLVLTEDTDSFIVGDAVYVDGIKPGRIQFIGDTKFGPGEWAGIFLDEPLGKNDGQVGSTRYFMCEPKHGVFSRLHRLTRQPIQGADAALGQIRRYGYEVMDAHTERRGSVGSGGGGSRRGSTSADDNRVGSISPYRATTPEARRDSLNRYSPDSCYSGGGGGRRGSGMLSPPEPRRQSMGNSPLLRRTPPGKSPLASPRNSRSNLGYVERDPDILKLAHETRRLSMEASNGSGGSSRRQSTTPDNNMNGRRQSTTPDSSGSSGSGGRRSSESPQSNGHTNGGGPRRPSEATTTRSNSNDTGPRRASKTPPSIFSRKTSESLGLTSNGRRGSSEGRKPSSELDATELSTRRDSEAGLRRPSATDVVLNDNTNSLMVGMSVWVDGNKHGRIAYLGEVHFAKGDMAGVHLDSQLGKNNGSVGGIMYFQCEPKRGVFSRLHRLSLQPLVSEEDEYDVLV